MAANSEPLQSLSLPFKTRIQIALLNLATDAVRRNDFTVNRRVMNLLDRRVPADPKPYRGVATHDVTVDLDRHLWFRLFVPSAAATSTTTPVIIFFHGGGFAFLSAASQPYDAVCRRFARRLNAVVCSVKYRLAPEHKFPAQYDDGFDVLTFLNDRRREIPDWPESADVTKCFVVGDSAGGNIAHHIAVRACRSTFSDLKVIGLINIQPFFGGKERAKSEIELEGAPIVSLGRTEWMWQAFLPNGLDMDHWAVNVCGPNAEDISGLDFPATVVLVGGFDPLQDWQRRYYEWLKRAGKAAELVEYPTAIHAFYVFPELPETTHFFADVKEFVQRRCSKAGNK